MTHLEQRPDLPVDQEDGKVLVLEAFPGLLAVEALQETHREQEDEERDRRPVDKIVSICPPEQVVRNFASIDRF